MDSNNVRSGKYEFMCFDNSSKLLLFLIKEESTLDYSFFIVVYITYLHTDIDQNFKSETFFLIKIHHYYSGKNILDNRK